MSYFHLWRLFSQNGVAEAESDFSQKLSFCGWIQPNFSRWRNNIIFVDESCPIYQHGTKTSLSSSSKFIIADPLWYFFVHCACQWCGGLGFGRQDWQNNYIQRIYFVIAMYIYMTKAVLILLQECFGILRRITSIFFGLLGQIFYWISWWFIWIFGDNKSGSL